MEKTLTLSLECSGILNDSWPTIGKPENDGLQAEFNIWPTFGSKET